MGVQVTPEDLEKWLTLMSRPDPAIRAQGVALLLALDSIPAQEAILMDVAEALAEALAEVDSLSDDVTYLEAQVDDLHETHQDTALGTTHPWDW